LPPCLQASFAALAPWGVVALLCLGLIETYRLAALWDEDDFEKRAYPGGPHAQAQTYRVRLFVLPQLCVLVLMATRAPAALSDGIEGISTATVEQAVPACMLVSCLMMFAAVCCHFLFSTLYAYQSTCLSCASLFLHCRQEV
jgi:hypothetical protein